MFFFPPNFFQTTASHHYHTPQKNKGRTGVKGRDQARVIFRGLNEKFLLSA